MSTNLHKTKTGKCMPQKLRRNERERKRVHQVNLGFERLRDRVPAPGPNKKLSKADTLREAVKYIRYLREQLLLAGASEEEVMQPTLASINNHDFHPLPSAEMNFFPYPGVYPSCQPVVSSVVPQRCSLNASPESGYGSTHSPESAFPRPHLPPFPHHNF